MNDENPYYIQAVGRAVQFLKQFSEREPRLSATELSKRLDLPPSTVLRYLATLGSEGFVERDQETGEYHLGIGCLSLARAFLSHLHWQEEAMRVLKRLRAELGETTHIAVLDGVEVVYVAKLEGTQTIALMASAVGSRVPAYCTALGKVLLADLDEDDVRDFYSRVGLVRHTPNTIVDLDGLMAELSRVRKQDFALDREEWEPYVQCVAAPVRDFTGRVIAAISISGVSSRIDVLVDEVDVLTVVRDAGRAISASLGYRPPAS